MAEALTSSVGAFPHREGAMSKKRTEKGDDSSLEAGEASMKTLLELFIKQQRAQQEQQREQQKVLLASVEQQKEELAQQRKDEGRLPYI